MLPPTGLVRAHALTGRGHGGGFSLGFLRPQARAGAISRLLSKVGPQKPRTGYDKRRGWMHWAVYGSVRGCIRSDSDPSWSACSVRKGSDWMAPAARETAQELQCTMDQEYKV